MKKILNKKLLLCLFAILLFTGCSTKTSSVPSTTNNIIVDSGNSSHDETNNTTNVISALEQLPEFSGDPFVIVNNNQPYFTKDEITSESFEYYSELDSLGRCGVCISSIGVDLMPTEKRESIGMVKPTGWHTVKYDNVESKYLYNRCHLIGFQLTGENANEKNLITGTRYLNTEGMLPFENMVADYIKETNNHVMYRVTPIFVGNNLVASGVLMEGYSVEDEGSGICFCVYCYNAQPGITIDYATGDSYYSGETAKEETSSGQETTTTYILNTNSKKFHKIDCSSVSEISEKNKSYFEGSRNELIEQGYSPCGKCNP